MEETITQQTYNKISTYINSLIDRLSDKHIRPDELPYASLKDLILNKISSYTEYLNPTGIFHSGIIQTFELLNEASRNNNISLCISLLRLLDMQLNVFITLDTSWMYTMNYNIKISSTEIYSMKQWDEHSLPQITANKLPTGRGCIYTCVTGDYDNLHDPEYIDPSLDYICFTDNTNIKSDIWKIQLIDNPENLDPIRLARKHKILCTRYLNEYDYSIYVDGKIVITGDMKELYRKYHLTSPILCMPHYERDCIYDEAEQCLSMKKGNNQEITNQIEKYKKSGYPAHNGLIDSCVLFRLHNSNPLIKMLDIWWNELKTESTRDQLSFPYACYQAGLIYDLCNFSIYNNPYFMIVNHNK